MKSDWLEPDSYKKDLAALKIKADGGLGNLIAEFFHFDTDEIDKRLAMLPKIQRAAEAFKKSKEVLAAGSGGLKLAGEVLALIPKVRKVLEQQKKEFQTKGAQAVDAQFTVMDWDGKPFFGANVIVVFESPGVPPITKMGSTNRNGFGVAGAKLRPSGTVSLSLTTGAGPIEGVTDYDFKPGQSLMRFKAIQFSRSYKTRAKSVGEATNKTGIKGNAGVEFKVVKVGGEVTSEDEYKKGFEDEVEWELQAGILTFKDFKQSP